MAWVAVAVAGTTLVTGAMSADAQRSAGNKAADAQLAATDKGIAENQRQFDALQKLLSPFVTQGSKAVGAQGDLVGLNGADVQRQAIQAIQDSPQYSALTKQGENAILQNASATGGLRGGNTQAALAQFRPQLLAQLIDQQYGRLGGLTSVGQNAAAGVGNAGMQTGQNISQLLQQGGAAQAGAFLNAGRAQQNLFGSLGSALGNYIGLGGKF